MVAVRAPVPTHLAASDVAVTRDIDCWMMDYSAKVSRYISEDVISSDSYSSQL